jgi:phosphoketolase
VNIHHQDEQAFRIVCSIGNLSFAQWIVSLGEIQLNSKNYEAFIHACIGGHLQVAKWLYQQLERKNHLPLSSTTLQTAFYGAAFNNYVEVIDWLYQLDPTIHLLQKKIVYSVNHV